VEQQLDDEELPDVYFGDKKPIDWREAEAEADPDDEELNETPSDVIALLGFDPLDEGE
jgi:hypothetical protein